MLKKAALSLLFAALCCGNAVCAETLELMNGDRVSGDVVYEDLKELVVRTRAMGDVSVKREFLKGRLKEGAVPKEATKLPSKPAVKKPLPKPLPPKPKIWKREVSFGYDRRTGNTQFSELHSRMKLSRKTKNREFKARGDAYYSSNRGRMSGQRLYGNTYYAPYFGKKARWYNFYKIEGDKDRFARIRYRYTPSSGLGYWFSNDADWKAFAELGAGFTHTRYTIPRGIDGLSQTEIVLTPRVFLEKRILPRTRVSQDLTFYPSITEFGDFRIRSETVFQNEISDRISLRLGIIDEYNNDPGPGAEKNDLRVITTLVYSF